MTDATADIEVKDNAERSRFEVYADGQLAGFAVYRRRPGRMIFVHTEIADAFEGRGIGSQLVSQSLDEVRASGEQVVPLCPFYAAFIERHPEYQDLVDARMMEILAGGD
jgi:predicted GNAT family acetyltransferase